MYNLLVSHTFRHWDGGVFSFDKNRFLEYTSAAIKEQLQSLSNEAIECIRSWPCVLMEEGFGEEVAHVVRILELHDSGKEIRLSVELCPSTEPILNDGLWRIREGLDIEQFEFSRNHWAVKERNLFSGLRDAGYDVDSSAFDQLDDVPLPAPNRSSLLRARDSISEWSHTKIDDLLLEAGVENLEVSQGFGSRRKRANAIVQFAIENPSVMTAEKSLFTAYLVRHALPPKQRHETGIELNQDVAPVSDTGSEFGPTDRSPNRVFVVHGRNDTARNAVVSFLASIGLEGIVLHEQPNMGRHLLTKFIEEAALVTFAVILMTDDDVGSLKDGRLAPRARQNVILELGYFLARLGQAKVCALITPGLETPSDFDGIAYIQMDDEHRWQKELKRELEAAGMPVIQLQIIASAD